MANIAILTNFQDFHPGYSLSGIVKDQCEMLTKYGNNVFFYTCDTYNEAYDQPLDATVLRKIPFVHLDDYRSETNLSEKHEKYSDKLKEILIGEIHEHNIEYVFTHDWVFTGWNLPYSLAIRKASPHVPNVRWLHWIHSVPSTGNDWWDIRRYGSNHRLVFPNNTERIRVAEQFKGRPEDVRIIPHIKDLRTFYDFDPETRRFIEDNPAMMQADFIQIYPASTDRLHAKQVNIVINLFGAIKRKGFTVFLVVANQWYGRPHEQKLPDYHRLAAQAHLAPDEFVFTSEWDERYNTGIPKKMLRELLLCSNIFIFPTVEESFGLVGPEAALAGNFMVLNKSLYMMSEIFGNAGLYVDFGSHHNIFDPKNINPDMTWDDYLDNVASLILGRFVQNESCLTRTYSRRIFNMDNLYLHYYEPLFMESKLWDHGMKAL